MTPGGAVRCGLRGVSAFALMTFITQGGTAAQVGADTNQSAWKPRSNPSWLMLQSVEPPSQQFPTLRLWGLVDVVYTFDDTRSLAPDNSMSVRRAYVGLRGSLLPDIDYFLLVDVGTGVIGRPSPLLLDASATLKHIRHLKVRVGQFKIPFGLEGLEAHFSPPLINFTRASVQLLALPGLLGLAPAVRLASNSAFRDIGVQLFDEIGKEVQLVYALGVFNGSGINTSDDNSAKDVVGRLEVASRGVRMGLSGLTGRESRSDLAKRRLGGDVTYNIGPLHVGSEVIWGRDELAGGGRQTAWGWHIRASYLATSSLQPVLRYEAFEPDTRSGDARFQAWALGVNWVFKGYTRAQLNYEVRSDEARPATGDLLSIQVQILF